MTFLQKFKRPGWLPHFSYQIWLLALGRLLSQMGSGFTLFYAPIFFVNQVGLSATQVGLGLGSASISGVFGRLLGGSMSDSVQWGRRKTLLMATIVAAIASFVLAASSNFPLFVCGNLLMGLGIGLYWPSAEAMIVDFAPPELHNEAFAVNRLSDSLGLSLGVVLGGAIVSATGQYRALFVIDGISFLVLFLVVYWAIAEVARSGKASGLLHGWGTALRDRRLLTFVAVNILFTTYIVQLNSTLPLYFTNRVALGSSGSGFDSQTISLLFTWHMILLVLCQLPVVRLLNHYSRVQVLILSALLWGLGFVGIWVTGVTATGDRVWAAIALAILALATVTYMPSASSTVVELAPESMRGVYLAVNSQCWAVGSLVGPVVGGWAMDQPALIAHQFWLWLVASTIPAIGILQLLQRMMRLRKNAESP